MKGVLKVFLTYLFIFAIFTILYLSLFNTSLFIDQKVLFYRGIILLIMCSLFFILISIFLFKKLKVKFETIFTAIVMAASINLSLFVVLPVTFERSVTMYLLRTLKNNSNNSCRGLSKVNLENKLIKDYVVGKAVEKRVNEQTIIGFIEGDTQCLQLTGKSLSFLRFSEIVSRLYGLK